MKNGGFGAVLVAAGSSSRMGALPGGRSKVLEDLGGRPVLCRSMETLLQSPYIRKLCVVCRQEEMAEIAGLAAEIAARTVQGKTLVFAQGGETRQESVWKGVQALEGEGEYLLFHDGARPFVSLALVEAVCRDALAFGAATAAVPSKDTCKLADRESFVESTPDRGRLWAVQTPQAFQRELYLYAAEKARAQGLDCTDDCQLVEAAGGRVKLTRGDYKNLKLTTPEDLLLARAAVEEEKRNEMEGSEGMRVGSGYDVHRLAEGRALILGGVNVPFERGLLGHSDADVLSHAVMDALLGAAALGDIGKLFPDSDPQYQGADSLQLLAEVCRVVRRKGWEIGNIDATVIAQRPKLAPHIEKMRENIARACGIDTGRVSVKATTEEGLGFTGRGDGIAAQAVCLLNEEG